VAILAGTPAVAVALLTLRTNVWYAGEVALLDELYVDPRWRGQGIGSAIIKSLTTISRDRGVDLIEINVDEGDVEAQRFYERHGSRRRSTAPRSVRSTTPRKCPPEAPMPRTVLRQSMMLPIGARLPASGHRAMAAPKIARERHEPPAW